MIIRCYSLLSAGGLSLNHDVSTTTSTTQTPINISQPSNTHSQTNASLSQNGGNSNANHHSPTSVPTSQLSVTPRFDLQQQSSRADRREQEQDERFRRIAGKTIIDIP